MPISGLRTLFQLPSLLRTSPGSTRTGFGAGDGAGGAVGKGGRLPKGPAVHKVTVARTRSAAKRVRMSLKVCLEIRECGNTRKFCLGRLGGLGDGENHSKKDRIDRSNET